MRYAIDTNILVYAEGFDDAAKQALAKTLVRDLPYGDTFVSINVLGELFNVLVRRGLTRAEAQAAAERWRTSFTLCETSEALMFAAIDLAAGHALSIWDALILAAAAEAGCGLLLSEDFQDGFVWNGVTVANPFQSPPHPLLAGALSR